MASGQSNIAEAGTVCSTLPYCRLTQFGTYVAQLTLEWSRLSQYTGDGKYSQLAENAALKIMNNVSPMKKVRDLLTLFFSLLHTRVSCRLVKTGDIHLISATGLPAQGINPSTGKPVGGYIGRIF
jgi:hypothetical protein